MNEFVIIDVETTGFSTQQDRICEFAGVKIANNRIIEIYDTLINPQRQIGNTHIHGIENSMVKMAPTFHDLAPTISRFIINSIIVAHKANFDCRFLHAEFCRLGYGVPNRAVCTLKMARSLKPNLRDHSLENLARHFKIRVVERHRALADAMITARIFLKLKSELFKPGRSYEGLFHEKGFMRCYGSGPLPTTKGKTLPGFQRELILKRGK